MIEESNEIRDVGRDIERNSGIKMIEWREGDVVRERMEFKYEDIVKIEYVMDEIEKDESEKMIERLWE